MLTELYKNRMKHSAIGVLVSIIIFSTLFFMVTEGEQWFIIAMGIVLVCAFGGTLISDYYKMKHANGLIIPVASSHVMETDQLIMKQAAWLFPRYWLFTTKGEYLGEIRLSSIPWYWHVLAIYFKKEIPRWFPFTAELRDHEGNKLAYFTKQQVSSKQILSFLITKIKRWGIIFNTT